MSKRFCVRKGGKILMWMAAALLLIVFVFILVREIWAASIARKISIDTPNGIDSVEYIEINGINQVIHIRGKDMNNPVILFLHGGPGFTDMPVSYRYQTEWEKYFTVVQWDQRMAGKTYLANKNDTGNADDGIDLRVSDTTELTKYLLQRFDKENLILVCHSWGTVLGINVIEKHPELYSVYVGIGQLVNLVESEKLGYAKALELAKDENALQDITRLEALAPYPNNDGVGYTDDFPIKMMKLREYQGKYEIGMPATYIENLKYFFPSPVYSLMDLRYYFTDVFKVNRPLYKYLYEDFDLRKGKLEFSIPTIFIYGENDWTTPSSLFEEIYEGIQSPAKELYIVKNAAHRPMNDNPEDFNDILINRVYSFGK